MDISTSGTRAADGSGRRITAGVNFEDGLGRRSSCELAAEYRISGTDITVYAASAAPSFEQAPEAVCFVLPAAMKLVISAKSSGNSGYSKNSRYLDFNGWRAGLIAGRFSLMNPGAGEELYLKALYRPGKEDGFFRTVGMIVD